MGFCYITRRGKRTGTTEQLGIYPIGGNGRPVGDVVVPNTLISLYSGIFQNDTAVTNVNLPDSIVSMDSSSFKGCTNLQGIEIPENTSTISDNLCEGCTSLTSVELSTYTDTIGASAFYDCSQLITVKVPNGITGLTIGNQAFRNCVLLNDDSVNALCAKLEAQPSSENVFRNNDSLKNVTTNYASSYWFAYCDKLQYVTILKGTNIGTYTFQGCPRLVTVYLPDTLKSLGSYAFSESGITHITIPKSVTAINSSCFYSCKNLTDVTIEADSALTTINSYAFEYAKIKSIVIPKGVTLIDDYSFAYCSNLTDVTVEDGASYTLDSYAFRDCTSLTNESAHNIMEHYSSVSGGIFYNCTGLTDVSVSRFWTYMFESCTNLVKAESLRGADTGNQVFYNCTKLQEVHIADGTSTIGYQVFYNCTALKKVYLPSSITSCTSSSLTSSSSSYYIFYGCTALEDVQVGEDWNMSLRLTCSNNITVESMVALFENLKDLTGETAKTITLGAANLAKLSDEQKAIATNKNWTLST